jgi:hypothetical protein
MTRYILISILTAIIVFNQPEILREFMPNTRQIPHTPFVIDTLNDLYAVLLTSQEQMPEYDNSFALFRTASITEAQINQILATYNSPAAGTGKYFIAAGKETGIDPAYILAIFLYESTAGTNPAWVGNKGNGTTHNIGNIRCAGYHTCYKGFRDYPDWESGITASFINLAAYKDVYGVTTIDEAIRIWAPPSENNTSTYVSFVHKVVNEWRSVHKPEFSSPPLDIRGEMGYNIEIALNANNGALRSVIIRPGETWSFNQTIGHPKNLPRMYYIAGVYGGGWCDLAGRYVQVGRQLGLTPTFEQHGGVALSGLSVADSPYIWNIDGTAGNFNGAQDLLLRNNTLNTVTLKAIKVGDSVVIIGGYGGRF